MAVACWGVNRRHKGLQQLSSFAETGRTFLGPLKASKFITDAECQESVLVSSTLRLLENLDVSNAVGQLLNEAIFAQHGTHGTGTTTLLFLAGAWSRAAEEFLHLGIPIPIIVSVMSEGLNLCTEEVAFLQVPVHLVFDHLDSPRALSGLDAARVSPRAVPPPGSALRQEDGHLKDGATPPSFTTSGLPKGRATPPEPCIAQAKVGAVESTRPCCRRSVLSRSRHLGRMGSSAGSSEPGASQGRGADPPGARACTDLAELAAGLSHGSDGCMVLVEAAMRLQLQDARGLPFALDISRLFTCCVPGLPDACSSVCPGFVTLVPASSVAAIQALARRPARVVVMDGDVTHTYRHPGFHAPGRMQTLGGVGCQEDGSEAAWADGTAQALAQLRVDLVLARGEVAGALAARCRQSGRLALGCVRDSALQAVAEASGAVPVLYVSQLHEACVGAGVSVALWPGPSGAVLGRDRAAVALTAEGAALVTAVLTGPVPGRVQAKEDAFWSCARRVQGALAEGKVFPGAGAVELLCVRRLLALADGELGERGARPPEPSARTSASLQAHRPAVLRGLAAGWLQYLSALLRNAAGSSAMEANTVIQRHVQHAPASGSPVESVLREHSQGCGWMFSPRLPDEREPGSRVYDAVTPKVEAWRRALDLVLLVLQTDSEIITGHGHTQMRAQHADGVSFL
ncbi:Bardet-Biedl syndrome 12 protein [Dipodomys spectabilis]|uniref:Bardet-Biedl syndrome 12 protein n=1 Tax=Dipodomys spectabilis TaxID=105255 RepID=UPI001C5346E0|nr:Bardet-Biedl syndrome 12 protein [Dipodomys spectabilis]